MNFVYLEKKREKGIFLEYSKILICGILRIKLYFWILEKQKIFLDCSGAELLTGVNDSRLRCHMRHRLVGGP